MRFNNHEYGSLVANPQAITATIEIPSHRNQDPYEILEIPKGASFNTIRKAYFRLARIHHPDHGGNTDMFMRIRSAYEVLTQTNRPNEMRFGNIQDAGAFSLAGALKGNTTLTEIDLRCNNIQAAGALRLAKALEVNRTLTSINLLPIRPND